ncbi:hypothetical protein HC891_18095 [Candidatus Gracilibacteria bacterium]|nr:hypothetical protein [Candidatus Gracilibacteria bacterium]
MKRSAAVDRTNNRWYHLSLGSKTQQTGNMVRPGVQRRLCAVHKCRVGLDPAAGKGEQSAVVT